MTSDALASRAALQVKLPDGRVVSMTSPEYIEWVDQDVADAPPLTAEQTGKLYVLLTSWRQRIRHRAATVAADPGEGESR